MVNGPQCAKNSTNRPQIQKVNVRKPKILTCLMGCNVSWFWKLVGRLFSWLVRSPKALLLGTPPRRVFRFSIFWEFKFLAKKLDFSNLRNFTPEQPSEARPRSSTPKMATRLRKYKLFSYFLPPDSLALLLQRGFLSYAEPRWFERFFRGSAQRLINWRVLDFERCCHRGTAAAL